MGDGTNGRAAGRGLLLTEMGELLNLLSWLKELLAVAENPTGVERVSEFIRMAQRRLWGDIQDVVDDSDEPGEG